MSFQTVQRFAFDRVFTEMGPTPFDMPDSMLDQAALRAELDARNADHESALSIARADAFEAGLAQARTERDAASLPTRPKLRWRLRRRLRAARSPAILRG